LDTIRRRRPHPKSNGWGDISNVTVNGGPDSRATIPSSRLAFEGPLYSFFVQDDITLVAPDGTPACSRTGEVDSGLPGVNTGTNIVSGVPDVWFQ
jgi:hypothetical protein